MFLINLDVQLTHLINSFSEKFYSLDVLFQVMTQAGPLLMVLLVSTHWYFKLNRELNRHFAIRTGIASALSLGLNQIIIFFYQRTRPYEMGVSALVRLPKSEDPSFPSDHASLVFSIVISVFFMTRTLKFKNLEPKLYLCCAILTSISRIWLGTHYLGDVIGGIFTALIANILVNKLYSSQNRVIQKLIKIF